MTANRTVAALLATAIGLLAAACDEPSPDRAADPDQSSTTVPTLTATTASASAPSVAGSLLAEPTGPAAVGVRDVPSVSPGATARLWYPALAGTGTTEPPYVSAATAASVGVTVDQLRQVRLRATLDATPAPTATPRPGVALMPGLGTPMALSTALAQDLASNGFVVLAVDPTLGSEDPDQPARHDAEPAGRQDQFRRALDFLTGPNVAALAGPVDAGRIAAGGHSIAGADAVQLSLTDSRIAAVFDLDGWLHGPALTTPVEVPALFVEASGFDPPTTAAIGRSTRAVTVELSGATHFDVTDLPCLAPALGPMAASLGLGTIGCTGSTTSNALVARFLRAVLHDGAPAPDATDLARGLAGIRPLGD